MWSFSRWYMAKTRTFIVKWLCRCTIDTDKVLDLGSDVRNGAETVTHKEFGKSKHVKKHQCSCNHQGSAGSMESVGAYRLFERSRETRKLEYVEFYGDGDSKSHLAVKDIYRLE
ncbi:hypothetical protein TNCV_2309471 [Trichonephila clavipes]|nr:hypothetical protein TNCV_2309471 [Trichonephila clavipes]